MQLEGELLGGVADASDVTTRNALARAGARVGAVGAWDVARD
jgi:hypothetical protein